MNRMQRCCPVVRIPGRELAESFGWPLRDIDRRFNACSGELPPGTVSEKAVFLETITHGTSPADVDRTHSMLYGT